MKPTLPYLITLCILVGCQGAKNESQVSVTWQDYLTVIPQASLPLEVKPEEFKHPQIDSTVLAKFGLECLRPLFVLPKKKSFDLVLHYYTCLEDDKVPALVTLDSLGNELDQFILEYNKSGYGMHHIAKVSINDDLSISQKFTIYEYDEDAVASDTLVKDYAVSIVINDEGKFETGYEEKTIRSTAHGFYSPTTQVTQFLLGDWASTSEEPEPELIINEKSVRGLMDRYSELPYRVQEDSLTVYDFNATYKYHIPLVNSDSLIISQGNSETTYYRWVSE